MQSAIDEITKRPFTKHKENRDNSRVQLVTFYFPVLQERRKNLSILYSNERVTDPFQGKNS